MSAHPRYAAPSARSAGPSPGAASRARRKPEKICRRTGWSQLRKVARTAGSVPNDPRAQHSARQDPDGRAQRVRGAGLGAEAAGGEEAVQDNGVGAGGAQQPREVGQRGAGEFDLASRLDGDGRTGGEG